MKEGAKFTEYKYCKSRNRKNVSVISAYTTPLYVMVDILKGVGLAPPPSPGRVDFSYMMECKPKSDHCHSVCTLWCSEWPADYVHKDSLFPKTELYSDGHLIAPTTFTNEQSPTPESMVHTRTRNSICNLSIHILWVRDG